MAANILSCIKFPGELSCFHSDPITMEDYKGPESVKKTFDRAQKKIADELTKEVMKQPRSVRRALDESISGAEPRQPPKAKGYAKRPPEQQG